MTPRVVVAGNLTLDDTVTPEASYPAAPGGDALYAALGVRAWGGTPVLLTLVGDDYPAAYLDEMVASGIDTSLVRPTAGPTVHYRVTYRVDGERTFGWVGSEERLLLTSPTANDYASLAGADWLHFAAMPIEAHEVGVAAARTAGVPISLDPHEEYVVGLEQRLRSLVEGAIFLPSELEARLLFSDLDTADPVDFAFAAAARLDDWRPAVVAVKLGSLGSVVRVDGRSVHVPTLTANVVDPTGAGDAYCGGFVVGWLVTGDAVIAAACGTVAAAETIERFGAFGRGTAPNDSERMARFAQVLDATAIDEAARVAAVERLRRLLDGQPDLDGRPAVSRR